MHISRYVSASGDFLKVLQWSAIRNYLFTGHCILEAQMIAHVLRPGLLPLPLTRWLIAEVALLILCGTVVLLLPQSHRAPLHIIDALLLAASAVCTTGLSSVNVSQVLTPFGQVWLSVLIELGALGTLLLAFSVVEMGRSVLSDQSIHDACEELGIGSQYDFRELVRRVFGLAFGIQFIGFLLLLPDMVRLTDPVQGLRFAFMHTIMAFGNAGFGLWPDGAARLSTLSLWVIMGLVVLGGLGFVTLDELYRRFVHRWKRDPGPLPPLSTQSQVGLKMTAGLLVLGALSFAALEWSHSGTLGPLAPAQKLLHATFQTTVTRSAGFSTLDYGLFSAPTVLLIMGLMFVGGSSGSTAGGIKITTLAVLLAATRSTIRRENEVILAKRTVPTTVLMRALTVVTLALCAIGAGTLALMLSESNKGYRPIALMFEAISAFTTSGLSINLTPHLSLTGKLVLVVLLYLGRVGLLGLVLSMYTVKPLSPYPEIEHEFTVG